MASPTIVTKKIGDFEVVVSDHRVNKRDRSDQVGEMAGRIIPATRGDRDGDDRSRRPQGRQG